MKRQLLLGLTAALTCLAAAAAWPATPVIERVDLERVRGGHATEQSWASDEFAILVSDADGAADLASVTVSNSGYTMEFPTDGYGIFEWTWQDANTLLLTIHEFGYGADDPFTITAIDATGHEATLSVPPPVLPTELPAITSPNAVNTYPVIQETAPTFSWIGIDPAAQTTLTVSRASGLEVWSYDPGATASVAYNTDSSALDAPLKAGFRYDWLLRSHRMVDDGVTDPRLHTSATEVMDGRFLIDSPTPTIEQVLLDFAVNSFGEGTVYYAMGASLVVTDHDGATSVQTCLLTDPEGVVHDPKATGDWQNWTGEDAYTLRARVSWPYPIYDTKPPTPGVYVVTASDAAGHVVTLSTPSVGPIPKPVAVVPAEGAVIHDFMPTLDWDLGAPSLNASMELDEEERPTSVWVANLAGDVTTFTPSAALEPELRPGHSYRLWVDAVTLLGESADKVVTILACDDLFSRFTVFEARPVLPALPGKLAYGMYLGWDAWDVWAGAATQQYSPDPNVRHWLGAAGAEHPDWSPDGTKLVYEANGEIWVDPIDGTGGKLVVPEPYTGAQDPSWSPDGAQIAYGHGITYGNYDLWIVNADGSNPHAVVADDLDARYARWSPNGQWIAYRRQSTDTDSRLWAVHPDGSGNHEIAGTGVVGYPNYQVTYVGESGWAPDATRLVVEFSAGDPANTADPGIGGIGVLPAGGGLLKPIFLTPSSAACCAAPKLPSWSADGTKIVFTSGHHLPYDPEWLTGKYEPGDELWMINADGSGSPTRLTYDYSLNGTATWWGPDPFSDVHKGNWAYCAISACKLAGFVVGQSGQYLPDAVVTRDQMAVYIARAMNGGDPTGPATVAFVDITNPWANAHIAYCVEHGVVRGYDSTHYGPSLPVTRDQMAVFIARSQLWVSIGEDMTKEAPAFVDVPLGHWAGKAIKECVDHGVVQGYDPAHYQPGTTVTRDQMAMFVARAFRLPM